MSPKFGEVKIPQKITPCPIVEAIIELRFDSDLPSEAIFGIFYGRLKNDYEKKVDTLPIVQIPESIRNQDPNLRFQPHYRLRSGDFILQIGPKSISLASTREYVGWNEFSKKIDTTISSISDIGVIKHVLRVGLRYINIFDFNIFDRINLKLKVGDDPFKASQITLRSSLKSEELNSNLQIANESKIEVGKILKKGSVIDIDTSIERISGISLKEISSLMNMAHIEEKKIFFSLLDTEYLNSLNPEY
jgi:uncharacterized protein (TIGR04255 family)